MAEASLVGLPSLDGAGGQLDRATTAQRVADLLRDRVLRGELPPGTQFAEQRPTDALAVSRNTLREAFQILIGERLVVREPHRGVFVRRLGTADVRDIYTFRRLVECAALASPAEPRGVADLRIAVDEGRAAAGRHAWHEVGTADVRFHMAVTALAGSRRVDRAMRAVFAELRLAFQLVPDPHALHQPFLLRNAQILELVESGRDEQAAGHMLAYLDEAEQIVAAAIESD